MEWPIALLPFYPTSLTSLMGMCYKHSTKWRYEFNHTESGVVTYGETKPVHLEEMKERGWILGDGTVDELYEYKKPWCPEELDWFIKLGRKPG